MGNLPTQKYPCTYAHVYMCMHTHTQRERERMLRDRKFSSFTQMEKLRQKTEMTCSVLPGQKENDY